MTYQWLINLKVTFYKLKINFCKYVICENKAAHTPFLKLKFCKLS